MSVFATAEELRPMARWQRTVLGCAACVCVALGLGFALGRGSVPTNEPVPNHPVGMQVVLHRQLPPPPEWELMPLAAEDGPSVNESITVAEQDAPKGMVVPPAKAVFQ